MIGTRKLWDKLENVPSYSYFVADRIRKHNIKFKVHYVGKDGRGSKRINFLMDKKDWKIILEELKEYQNKRGDKNENL